MSTTSSLAVSSSTAATLPDSEPDSEPWHGKVAGYTYRACRGPRCTAAQRAYIAEYRSRRRQAEAAGSATDAAVAE